MARFYCLYSSSKGNAHYVGTPKEGLLIDAGASCAGLRRALLRHQIPLTSIKGIFITHSHSDHVKGLKVLLKQLTAKVWATAETLQTLMNQEILSPERIGGVLEYGAPTVHAGYEVTAFSTPHDADGSCGFHIKTPDERRCSICTDLGYMPDSIMEIVKGSHLVLLEANYDKKMLANGIYPAWLKARVAGSEGHLSNEDSAAAAVKLVRSGTTRLILGHLSQENNLPALAWQTVTEYLAAEQYREQVDYLLTVASPNGCEGMVVF